MRRFLNQSANAAVKATEASSRMSIATRYSVAPELLVCASELIHWRQGFEAGDTRLFSRQVVPGRQPESNVLESVEDFALRVQPVLKRVAVNFSPDFVKLVGAQSDSGDKSPVGHSVSYVLGQVLPPRPNFHKNRTQRWLRLSSVHLSAGLRGLRVNFRLTEVAL